MDHSPTPTGDDGNYGDSVRRKSDAELIEEVQNIVETVYQDIVYHHGFEKLEPINVDDIDIKGT